MSSECHHIRTQVIRNQREKGGRWVRVRICTGCGVRFNTVEVKAADYYAELDHLRSLAVKWNLQQAGIEIK